MFLNFKYKSSQWCLSGKCLHLLGEEFNAKDNKNKLGLLKYLIKKCLHNSNLVMLRCLGLKMIAPDDLSCNHGTVTTEERNRSLQVVL